MASETHMAAPMCLIENVEGRLVPNPTALELLSAITQPMVVVAIVGLYRTGKSYLMNKLAGKTTGFSVGSTVQSHTKGIWMWCVPHPQKADHTLVLLDTEGLGDVEKVEEKDDIQIFAMAILLSSSFVYNTMSKIDQGAIDLLHNVTELTELLRTRNPPEINGVTEPADAVSFFPDLVWTLRDFFLDLEKDGQAITSDEYLENSLKLKQGSDEKIKNFNLPRLCIQKFFPIKKCFVFDSPTRCNKLAQLETLSDDELFPEFMRQLAEFCSYIFSHSKVKTLPGDIQVNGPRLESLVLTYANAINKGDLPCMESTVVALAQRENTAAVQKAIAHYDQQMGQKVKLPTETLQELLDLHRDIEKEAIEIFQKHCFKDEDHSFQKELETSLNAKQDDICKKNVEASEACCSTLLQSVFSSLDQAVAQGVYSKPGGHNLYIQKIEELKARYHQEPGKGIQAEEVLQTYLKSKESLSNSILQTDQALTAKEREKEAERARVTAARAEAQRLQAIHRQEELERYQMEILHQRQLRQIDMDRANLLAEQRRREKERFWEEAEKINAMHQAEIRRLQEQMKHVNVYHHKSSSSCVIQ